MPKRNPFQRLILSVVCPVCGADIGRKCDKDTKGAAMPNHYARYLLAKSVNPEPFTRGKTTLAIVLKPQYNKGSNPSGKCQKGKHAECKGFCAPKYGYKAACTCHCHDTERKQQK